MAKTEVDLARRVREWLEHYTVYQEVGHWSGAIADLVVDVGGFGWVIECKLSLGLSVMAQAERWYRDCCARRVSIAVPAAKRDYCRERSFAIDICRRLGIGVIEVELRDPYRLGNVKIIAEPQPMRTPHRALRKKDDILSSCRGAHQWQCEAGSQSGRRVTSFSATMSAVVSKLANSGECDLKSIVEDVRHHYGTDSAARANLRTWLNSSVGRSYGIEARIVGHKLLFSYDPALDRKSYARPVR